MNKNHVIASSVVAALVAGSAMATNIVADSTPSRTWYACANAAGAGEATRQGLALPTCANKTDKIYTWDAKTYSPPTTSTTVATSTTTTLPQGVNKARPFSANSPWNTLTASNTPWFNTPSLHTLGDGSFRHWWVNTDSVGIWWSSPSDPLWTFNLPDYIAPAWHRNRPAATFQTRAPATMVAGTDADHILLVIDPVSGNYVEVWQANVDTTNHIVTNFSGSPGWATGNAITGPGGGTLSNNDGVRAANFSWAAGLITGSEISAGKIDHALVLALPFDMLMGGGQTGLQGGTTTGQKVWRAPATAWDAGFWSGPIQMGSKIGVPAGVTKPAGLSPIGSMVFDALQKYGSYVGDFVGGQWPEFVADSKTVVDTQICSLFCYWNYNGSADMEKIGPLLRVADYQP